MKFRAPASILLRRAQLTLMLATLVPTVLMTALGIVMLAVGSGSVNLVAGVLLLAFCTTSLTGYILGSIFVSRGASLARVQNDFLSSVSHELRTPLTSIRMFIETLRDRRLSDPEQRQCLDLLHREVQRLDGLVDRVMQLSRIEGGGHAFEQKRLVLADVVRDALLAFEAATLAQPTAVEVRLDEAVEVLGDREALALAVTNLLMNAYKYSPADARRIRVEVVAISEKEAELNVLDNGVGVPRDEQQRIFEHFERGRSAIDGRTSGSGLGLAIVRAIAEAHHGKVELRSREGLGAQFRIRLKRLRSAGK